MQLVFARKRPLIDIEPRTVTPGAGDLKFRCGRCGFSGFHAHVRPTALDQARIRELVCGNVACKTVFAFDDVGRLERGGTLEE